jgi:hypothetical protein
MSKMLRRLSLAAFLGAASAQVASAAIDPSGVSKNYKTSLSQSFPSVASLPPLRPECRGELSEFSPYFLNKINKFLGVLKEWSASSGLDMPGALTIASSQGTNNNENRRPRQQLSMHYDLEYNPGTAQGLDFLSAHPHNVFMVLKNYNSYISDLEKLPDKNLRETARKKIRPNFDALNEEAQKWYAVVHTTHTCLLLHRLK